LSTYVGLANWKTRWHSSRCFSGLDGASTMKQSTAALSCVGSSKYGKSFFFAHARPDSSSRA
jgi:hypothetical protein